MNSLIEVLREQASFGFTGKVNVLSGDSGQFLGVVYQQDGFIVGASFSNLKNRKALIKMIFDDVESNHNFKFVVEPELLSNEQVQVKLTVEEIKKDVQSFYQEYIETKKLKPHSDIRLVIDPLVIVSKEDLSALEFDVLATISEWPKVGDIYKYSKLLDFEITKALVTLRKKKAIRVLQAK